jgi:hypothetical protein
MYYKCDLLVGGYSYSITDYIQNWDDITVSFKRGDYDGIVRTFTDKFEFVKGARGLLLKEYELNYLNSKANVVISTRNNSWTWTERFRCALNFSTLSDNGFILSMNAVDDSVASIIKAKKGTQYEYAVSDIKSSIPLKYDGLMMKNDVLYTIPPDDAVTTIEESVHFTFDENGYYTIPLYVQSSEIVRKNEIEDLDQSKEFYNASQFINSNPYFFKNTSKEPVTINLSISFSVWRTGNSSNDSFTIISKSNTGFPIQHFSKDLTDVMNGTVISVDMPCVVPSGYMVQMYMFSQYGGSAIKITNMSKMELKWESRRDVVDMDVIKPSILLNSLLKSMDNNLSGVIIQSGEKRLDNAMILAAESARKIPDAKIYSSFDHFAKWMSAVFGYVYDISGNIVTFRPREDYFGKEVVKVIDNYNGYQMNVNSSLIYSQVSVGYNKQDYDSVNGKDEFRFTNYYNTGVTMTDGKLEIISPYRADAYGIEFLSQKIGEDTTDNESDNGIFFVCINEESGKYVLDRTDSIAGVISPTTMFNTMYSPASMIKANKAFLGGFISELSYASSDGNSAVTINGKAENGDIYLNDGLFSVNEIEIETSDIDLPEDMTGLVQFEHQGRIKYGYYKNSDFHYTKTKSAKITLIEKK